MVRIAVWVGDIETAEFAGISATIDVNIPTVV
jgi:hypothetical protein